MCAAMLAVMTAAPATARDLVVTLRDGRRYAYALSTKAGEHVVMTRSDGAICIAGDTYALADVRELRIFKDAPDEAIRTGVRDITTTPAATQPCNGSPQAVDLGGRAMQGTRPRKGIYIVRHRKIAVR